MARLLFTLLSAGVVVACGDSSSTVTAPLDDAGAPAPDGAAVVPDGGASPDGGSAMDGANPPGDAPADSPVDAPPVDNSCAGPCPMSNIKHLVLLVQDNHTFDDHFGGYCTAAAGSNPTCTAGPACCEAAPAMDPSGHAPVVMDDAEMGNNDPNHTSSCEAEEIDNGKMDGYVTASVGCGSTHNVALASPSIIKPYWDLAAAGALGDRYFQPIVGASSSNDMYYARAQYVFTDNSAGPQGAVGMTCESEGTATQYPDKTIGDLLDTATVPWAMFAGGYQAMKDAVATGGCAPKPAACPFFLATYPCIFDPSDVPFEYYASTRDNPSTMKDVADLYGALAGGGLPAVSFVRAVGYLSEHPGTGTKLSDGVAFATDLFQRVATSRYRASTLVLLTYDEGGGYFDHVSPPAASAVDGKSYGTRVPFLAVGPFAKKGAVSHVVMEHSSLVKFMEWNWLGGTTGQLAGRDATVANIGSVLDATATGTAVPTQ